MRRLLMILPLAIAICTMLTVTSSARAAEPGPYDGSYTITIPEQTVGPSNCHNIDQDVFTMQISGSTASVTSSERKIPGTVSGATVTIRGLGMKGQLTASGSGVKVAGTIDIGDPDCPFKFTGVRTSAPAEVETVTPDSTATRDQTATDEAATTDQTPTTNEADEDNSGGFSSTALIIAVILILAALGVGVFFVRPGR